MQKRKYDHTYISLLIRFHKKKYPFCSLYTCINTICALMIFFFFWAEMAQFHTNNSVADNDNIIVVEQSLQVPYFAHHDAVMWDDFEKKKLYCHGIDSEKQKKQFKKLQWYWIRHVLHVILFTITKARRKNDEFSTAYSNELWA